MYIVSDVVKDSLNPFGFVRPRDDITLISNMTHLFHPYGLPCEDVLQQKWWNLSSRAGKGELDEWPQMPLKQPKDDKMKPNS